MSDEFYLTSDEDSRIWLALGYVRRDERQRVYDEIEPVIAAIVAERLAAQATPPEGYQGPWTR